MVIYTSSHGPTASPICYLMFLEFVNRQNYEMTVDHYSVEVGRFRYIPWWHKLRPIPLAEMPVYAIGIPPGANPTPGKVWFPKGTYLLGEHPEARGQLEQSQRMNLEPIFELELTKPVPPHGTIQGWAAFDRSEFTSPQLRGQYLRIRVTDSAGNTSDTVAETPLCTPDEIDTGRAMMQPIVSEADLSHRYLKFYSQP